MTDWTGKRIGAYQLDRALGPDRYGTRYSATDTGTGATVEVRLIAPPTADDRWFADRVASTLRRYEGISAPDLAPLLAVGDAEGTVYTVGPLLVGETLRARIGAPLPLAEVVATLAPIAAALDALHGRYLPHGGLQPEAIVLDPAGPLLRDAGVAAALTAAARLAAPAAATPSSDDRAYRAPEAQRGSSSDPRADIYSLAVVAYEALTGRTPFAAANGDAAQPAPPRGSAAPPAPRELNPALSPATESALLRGLAQYPYERPERASAFIASLAAEASATTATSFASPTPAFAPAPTFAPPPAAWTPGKAPPPNATPAPPTPAAPSGTPPAPMVAPATSAAEPSVPPATTAAALPLPSTAPPAPAIVPAVPAPIAAPPPPPVVAPPLAPEPYHYQSPEAALTGLTLVDAPRRELQDERAALVNTLAALANHWTALAQERQRALGALRAVETARGGAQQPARRVRSRDIKDREATRRPTPTQRAARYAERAEQGRTEWREVFSVPTGEAVTGTIGTLGSVVVAAFFFGSVIGSMSMTVMILLGAVIYGVARVRSETRHTLICTPAGFVIEDHFLPWQPISRFYRWSDVSDLRYVERLTGNKKAPKLIGDFAIMVDGRVVADVTDRYPGFDLGGLIALFARETTQLPFSWVPNLNPPLVSGGQRAERYAKIAREARLPTGVS